MKIYFKIYNLEDQDLIEKVKNVPSFRGKLLLKDPNTFPYAEFGKLCINFYSYNFIIDTEMVWSVLIKHIDSIESILNGEEIDKYEYFFEMEDTEYMMFNFDGNTGLRIRHYGNKSYYDDNDEILYVSYDHVKQEIIVNKQEYVEKMLDCATRFISYRELLNETHLHFFHWKNKVIELKKQVDSLK